MSRENVEAFYQRLASDEAFRNQLQAVKSKAECTKIVRQAGYYFTSQEYEEYTAKLLDLTANDGELQELNEKELEAVFGGASSIIVDWKNMQQPYGVVNQYWDKL